MKISKLKTIITNGGTIAHRKFIGKSEFNKIITSLHEGNTPYRDLITISVDQSRLFENEKGLVLKLIATIKQDKNTETPLILTGKDINLHNIFKKIEAMFFENIQKHHQIIDEIFESKTLKKLYSPEFKVHSGINKDGYYITTIMDRKTGKPVKAYLKRSSNTKLGKIDTSEEVWHMYVKNSNGEYINVGNRSFGIDHKTKTITHGWMTSIDGNKKYKGIAIRLHQIPIELLMRENYKSIVINSTASAFAFHYMCGFRAISELIEHTSRSLDKHISNFAQKSCINKRILEKTAITKVINGKLYYDSKSEELFRILLFLRNKSANVSGNIPMELKGKQLEEWLERIKEYPILTEEKI